VSQKRIADCPPLAELAQTEKLAVLRAIVIGRPNQLLGNVLPCLATLPSVIAYNCDARTLTFRRTPGFLTLYSDRAYITQVKNAEEGLESLAALKDAINATMTNRRGCEGHRGSSFVSLRPLRVLRLMDGRCK
jgi:ArsR family metal-binding transcriptional regulator